MAYYPINVTGNFGTIVGAIGTAVATSDVLVYNDTESAITYTLQSGATVVETVTLNKKSTTIHNNPGAGVITLTSGQTTHKTSAHDGARVHAFISGTVDQPAVPTDNEVED